MKMKFGSGRLFGFFYLASWCAALAALIYFMPEIHWYWSIAWALLLFFLAPDIETSWRLLSGKEDKSTDGNKK